MRAEVLRICEAVRAAGGRAMLVGGSVRDLLLGRDSKDFDIEVYRVEPADLRRLLEQLAPVNAVGEHFAVYKLVFPDGAGGRFEVDVSIPRRESKTGRGHRGFLIEGDPWMSYEEAARRRDFTINAILYDPLTDEFVDPFGGRADLRDRVLRVVDPETFVEDSLRVLRAVQFAARFDLIIEPRTVALCRAIELGDLPRERVWGEVEKLLLLARRPSKGLDAARDLGVLDKLFPEIAALLGCPQDAAAHPEGDAFAHTRLALDEAAKQIDDLSKARRVAVMLATLCHDLGKPLTTVRRDGRVEAPGHDAAGVAPTLAVLDRLGLFTLAGYDVRAQVVALVREHLRPREFFACGATDGDFRRLARRVELDLLYRVDLACQSGRGPASSDAIPRWFIERARRLGVAHEAPTPILMGRHLLDLGFAPGPAMGRVLQQVYELQLDGAVSTLDEALAAARRLAPGEADTPSS